MKDYRDRIVLLQADSHDLKSLDESKGIRSVKQRGAVERSARAAPLALGSQVHANLQNFSPVLRISHDKELRVLYESCGTTPKTSTHTFPT
jgi:hypothetical protein